ncbi:YheC/YheD family protein [Paenibacillus daejeonensis]|uniref:YheC/YheD family endospore coat-associated protein n=1 Tax=Paenibacillus daejeonensis TaxID=135193 RepID=UPI00036E9994|nr:YheC/YheD family protein [Paenibacillus daejeonensis]
MQLPYVGILLDPKLYWGIPTARTGKEQIRFYEDAARLYEVALCFFRLGDLRSDGSVLAFIKHEGNYKRVRIPLPEVIHNRTIQQTTAARRQMAELQSYGSYIFNSWNRYSKLYLHQLLMKDTQLRPHLPGTMTATAKTVREMKIYYDSLIVKPDNSSIGRGVMKLDRIDSGWQLTYPHRGGGWRTRSFTKGLPLQLRRQLRARRYMVQQRLPLATYQGSPFDLRVSVQRCGSGEWAVTGIAAKVAAPGSPVTNVARGGSVYRLETVLSHLPEVEITRIRSGIADFCLHAAGTLSAHLPNLADLGFDIGLTGAGFPMFIECNGRDLRYSFQKAGMLEEWRRTYASPIGYARHLLDQRRTKER